MTSSGLLLISSLAAMVAMQQAAPLLQYLSYAHHPAAYSLVSSPIYIPPSHYSAVFSSNQVGGSFAYSVQAGQTVPQVIQTRVIGSPSIPPVPQIPQIPQIPVVANHYPNPATGFPIISNAISPQWVLQSLPGGGVQFVPAGAGVRPAQQPPPAGGAAPVPPSVNVDDVVTVSDEADGAVAAGGTNGNDEPAKEAADDGKVEGGTAETADDDDADSVSVDAAQI